MYKEDFMVEVTESATQKIGEYFEGKEISPIRIFLNEGGWGGPSLALALDEQKETDHVYEIEGFTYIVDKDFMDKVKPIKIEFLDTGFKLTTGMDLGTPCSSCDTARSCCSWSQFQVPSRATPLLWCCPFFRILPLSPDFHPLRTGLSHLKRLRLQSTLYFDLTIFGKIRNLSKSCGYTITPRNILVILYLDIKFDKLVKSPI